MFTQTPTHTEARFKALQFRAQPITVSQARQSRAAALAPTIRAIKPGVYLVGGKHYIDLWRNLCTCREHRIGKVRPCRHRLALWLAEGVQIDDPDPALYLKDAQVEQPEIIAWYAEVSNLPGQYRIEFTEGGKWLMAFPVNGGDWQICTAEDLFYVTPFYE